MAVDANAAADSWLAGFSSAVLSADIDTLASLSFPTDGSGSTGVYMGRLIVGRPRFHRGFLEPTLHSESYPTNWSEYTPRENRDWLEQYATGQDLVVWTNAELQPRPKYNEETHEWDVDIRRDGKDFNLRPAHIVLATGALGAPTSQSCPTRSPTAARSSTPTNTMARLNFWQDNGDAELITNGRVKVKSGVSLDRFTKTGLVLSNGNELPADAAILATGYLHIRDTNRALLGDEIIDKTVPVYGLDSEGELKGSYRPSGRPGLWFATGDFFVSRFMSKVLGLRLKAGQLGVLPTN
ncbi:uncharacterized protein BXZ73DRAFT_105324 [Epithele typhae]|uniref:uncharacterized protein n=1 Tax=Epithele typhae TaxID=378194 RepID=UPI00200805D1|nr:uncharacterized protein BXZ73DRAFT_105324 [Epithele typhae]KAH9918198.1 hypothetical protein BXZ73DRAFT_105324 [Epithele typhae]